MRRFDRTAFVAILVLSLTGTAAHADTRAGRDAFQRAEFETALKELQPEAESGDVEAQYFLGKMYQSGLGVPKDLKKAGALFAKSADGGYPDAQYAYGVALVLGEGVEQDFVEGVKWLIIASRMGGHAGAKEQLDKLPMPREVASQARKAAVDWQSTRGKLIPKVIRAPAKSKTTH